MDTVVAVFLFRYMLRQNKISSPIIYYNVAEQTAVCYNNGGRGVAREYCATSLRLVTECVLSDLLAEGKEQFNIERIFHGCWV